MAARTATKATSKAATPAVEEDLLAGLGDSSAAAVDDNESLDLLDGITEEQGDAWMPADEDGHPEGIQGKLIFRSVIETDSKFGGGTVPYLEIQEANGHVWSVRGYHTVLRNQIEKADPQVGDTVAIKYLGEKENRKGDNSYQNYGLATKKA